MRTGPAPTPRASWSAAVCHKAKMHAQLQAPVPGCCPSACLVLPLPQLLVLLRFFLRFLQASRKLPARPHPHCSEDPEALTGLPVAPRLLLRQLARAVQTLVPSLFHPKPPNRQRLTLRTASPGPQAGLPVGGLLLAAAAARGTRAPGFQTCADAAPQNVCACGCQAAACLQRLHRRAVTASSLFPLVANKSQVRSV